AGAGGADTGDATRTCGRHVEGALVTGTGGADACAVPAPENPISLTEARCAWCAAEPDASGSGKVDAWTLQLCDGPPGTRTWEGHHAYSCCTDIAYASSYAWAE